MKKLTMMCFILINMIFSIGCSNLDKNVYLNIYDTINTITDKMEITTSDILVGDNISLLNDKYLNNVDTDLLEEFRFTKIGNSEDFTIIIAKVKNNKDLEIFTNAIQLRMEFLLRENIGDNEFAKNILNTKIYTKGNYIYSLCISDTELEKSIYELITDNFERR